MIYQLFIYGFVFIAVFDILFNSQGPQRSFRWILFAFIFGYRSFDITPGFSIHPLDILIYITIIKILLTPSKRLVRLPNWLNGLFFFMVLHLLINTNHANFAIRFFEFKNLFHIVIIFYIVHITFVEISDLKYFSLFYILSVSMIAFLGVVEFHFPSITMSMFGSSSQLYSRESGIFYRAGFTFWGAQTAANLIPPVFPFLLLHKNSSMKVFNPISKLIIGAICIYAIYISGNRISWLILSIMLLSFFTMYRKKNSIVEKIAVFLFIISFVTYINSELLMSRYFSAYSAILGQADQVYDSSGHVRYSRAVNALEVIFEYPLGIGWAGSGWVHSDVLQIIANLGWLAGILFVIGLFNTMYKCFIVYINHLKQDEIKLVLFTSLLILVHVILSFLFNNNFVLPQSGVPLFLLWAIIDTSLNNYNPQFEYKINDKLSIS